MPVLQDSVPLNPYLLRLAIPSGQYVGPLHLQASHLDAG
jgi:hypothetical protein